MTGPASKHARDSAADRPGLDDPGGPRKKDHWVWRIITITFGCCLVLLGLIMLVTPGPGWVAIFAGLAVLSPHSRKARWILRTLKEKISGRRTAHD